MDTRSKFRCRSGIVIKFSRVFLPHWEETLTSVRRTALCWDAMLPRPEQTCGSSVMLCSPSCSASLSDRFAPLWTKRSTTVCKAVSSVPLCVGIAPLREQAYFISSSLMSSNLFMLGKRSCISFLTPRLIPTGTTFMLLQGGTTNVPVSGMLQ